MQDSPLINEFQDYLIYEKHFSEHTIKCYSADLKQYMAYLSGQGSRHSDAENGFNDQATATAVAADLSTQIIQADVNTVRTFLAQLNEQG